ncbi:hypothetical protein A3C57_02780 [Candidatus Nomurabacteria bacterium RIFCSPHIGHO2_02_FULL_33_12]|uniref:Uncharacterized protein n=1 Tax=Candidatus Nomurabacteria bacterium RIFCSPLOWO2_01_FULL_33_17 TaxID=1801764 RepID=A0A1F6WQ03_9BACT|nr:MAG: hypothetical protein A3C57_02780 [Candidatus Nomurabacteria bacterium RIFCSPHIGHO2_02_FULL_33_12]OGI83968.1 MAG: hypothetical protein A2903_00895 [Candidatus Nomurabacteria bacterium RIFCSPLOWO2_01_FULL_33_17]
MKKIINPQKQIEIISRTNFKIISLAFGGVFIYLILLGFTATNVVAMRTLNKTVDDKKTELSKVELDYMSAQNIIALETMTKDDFTSIRNISYVSLDNINFIDIVAFSNIKK